MLGVWLGPVVALVVLVLTIPIVRFLQKKSAALDAFSGASGPVDGEEPHEELLGEIRNTQAEIRILHAAFSALKLEIDALATSLIEHRRIVDESSQRLEQFIATQAPSSGALAQFPDWSGFAGDFGAITPNVSGLGQLFMGSVASRLMFNTVINYPTHEAPKDDLGDLVVPDTPAELFKGRPTES